ncbi:MAG: hypothetical protein IPI59_09275 [Sphingobacteriales bacterium]|jgi:hypothetical protein|nr:hypothetical protein [Sphingobacteriales bacterium]MBP9140794.1 hypothetical protein [Chitinophagales bacterium]MDA0200009.1 hypothetical protein [Bacteroidota bacterium]MBK6889762.1 hypothetical protein [Sphingobacteriales bacterium]MBK7527724.1 hypothetical protein [Sphingobacteriales bacterium]
MKQVVKYLSITFLYIFLSTNLIAADVLTADISPPTYNLDCKNGKIDLHINGGFTPYGVFS